MALFLETLAISYANRSSLSYISAFALSPVRLNTYQYALVLISTSPGFKVDIEEFRRQNRPSVHKRLFTGQRSEMHLSKPTLGFISF